MSWHHNLVLTIIIKVTFALPDKCKNKQSITARYEVHTAVLLQIQVIQEVTLCQ
jgi:hypothetical protein